MLQSARVRPSSSCLRAGRNLHLEGNGFVALERDNLAVEGGFNLGPRHLRSRTEQRRAEEPPASRRRGLRGGRARTWRLAAEEVVVRRRRGDGVELDDEVEVERGGVGRRSSMAAARRILCVLLYLRPRATPPPPLHCCTASRPNRRRIRRIHGWIDLVAAWFGSISSSSFSSSHAMATGELRNVLADGAFTVSSLPPLSSPQLAAPLLSSLPWRAAATTSARWGRGGAVASVAHDWKTLDLGFTGKRRMPRSTVSCGVPFLAPSATGLIDRMGDVDG
jgi:hypothetical protein